MLSKFCRQVSLGRRTLRWRYAPTELQSVILATIAVSALLLGVRELGGLQPLELMVYDRMVRLRPDPGSDSRLLIVSITEADIRALKKWPPSDEILAQLFAQLQLANPRSIGLDLFRDIPTQPGYKKLVEQLRKPNVITVSYLGSTPDERIAPPPSVPKERVGFADVITDPDGAARRNLLIDQQDKKTVYSFSLQLALQYLNPLGIQLQITENQEYKLGKFLFSKLKKNSGGYQNIDAIGYQILLNYRSKNVARQVTFSQVLNKQVDPILIKDKIVLIGATAPSLKDSFPTPYSPAELGDPEMPGVVVHAQMVSQILSTVLDNQPLFWFWDEWTEVLWITAWSMVGGVAGWKIHRPLFLGLFTIGSLGILFGCGFTLFLQAGWIPLVAPALALIGTGGFVVTYQIQQAQQQQQIVMKLLGQQTAPEIAKALWQERDRLLQSGILPGQTLTATMLFTDIKNFSTIAEQISSAVLMSWLNEYFNAMSQAVIAHHGIVNKFIGDGLMAVFGVPVPRTTEADIALDAQRAVNCALAMRDRLQELNRTWVARGLPVIQIRAGIFTGAVTVGSLGGKERLEYAVIGDSVNIAARLEGCQKERQVDLCRILIAKETLVHLQGQFEVEPWGALELKGKRQTVEVYRVLGRVIQSSSQEG